MTTEEESLRSDRNADERAEVLLEIGLRSTHLFCRNGRTFGANVAFQSQVLVRDLLKLGLFSMRIHSMAGIEDAKDDIPVSFSRIPSSLLAVGLHYAIEVAPTDQNSELGAPVILLDELDLHIQKLEAHFSQIVVDMELVARISRLARLIPDMPDLHATASDRT